MHMIVYAFFASFAFFTMSNFDVLSMNSIVLPSIPKHPVFNMEGFADDEKTMDDSSSSHNIEEIYKCGICKNTIECIEDVIVARREGVPTLCYSCTNSPVICAYYTTRNHQDPRSLKFLNPIPFLLGLYLPNGDKHESDLAYWFYSDCIFDDRICGFCGTKDPKFADGDRYPYSCHCCQQVFCRCQTCEEQCAVPPPMSNICCMCRVQLNNVNEELRCGQTLDQAIIDRATFETRFFRHSKEILPTIASTFHSFDK